MISFIVISSIARATCWYRFIRMCSNGSEENHHFWGKSGLMWQVIWICLGNISIKICRSQLIEMSFGLHWINNNRWCLLRVLISLPLGQWRFELKSLSPFQSALGHEETSEERRILARMSPYLVVFCISMTSPFLECLLSAEWIFCWT